MLHLGAVIFWTAKIAKKNEVLLSKMKKTKITKQIENM